MPGMLYAAIEIAPVYGGKLMSVDTAPAEAMPGVKKVVKLEDAVAVVADSFWRARRALAALKPEFDDAGHGDVSTASIFAAFDKALGAPPAVPKNAAKVVTADYRAPFLAHATMEPMVCTAKVEGDRAEVWAGVQDPLNARSAAAKALGISVANVRLTNFLLGGGFGRRLPFTFDYVDLGVRMAKAMSPTPVKTIWTRENDIQHDYYRGAALSRHAGALDANGAPLAAHSNYTGGGNGEAVFMPYAIAAKNADEKKAAAPDPARAVAVGAQLAARLLQGVVHRRDGARGRQGSVRVPARPAGRSAALQGGARESGGDVGLGHAAPAGRRTRHRHLRKLRHDRRRSGARRRSPRKGGSRCCTSTPRWTAATW